MKLRLLSAILLTWSAVTAAESSELGRLFRSPLERQQLDRQRWRNPYYQPGAQQPLPPITPSGRILRPAQAPLGRQDELWRILDSTQALPMVGETLFPSTGERRPLLGSGHVAARPEFQP